MADCPWIIRRATAGDREFLADMLLEAVNWSPEWKPRSRRRVLSDPRTARYIADWPRDTDLGVIAEAGSQPGRRGLGPLLPGRRSRLRLHRSLPAIKHRRV